jgi:hemolysin activation/secretion protein
VGLRWPGVSVGVRDGPYTLELKHLRESSDISITGFRLYHHLLDVSQSNLYWGLDVSRISFQGDVSDGNGHSTGVYFGFQKQFANRLSWSLDLGPYYISLRDEQTNLTVDGFEFTMTTGLNLSLW